MIKNNLGKAFVLYFLINIHCGGDSGQELQREQSKPGGVAHTFNPSSRDEGGSWQLTPTMADTLGFYRFPAVEMSLFSPKGFFSFGKPYWWSCCLVRVCRVECQTIYLCDFAVGSDITVILKGLGLHKLTNILSSCCNKYLMNKLITLKMAKAIMKIKLCPLSP